MTTLYKYPRTPHLPWSPGYSGDDIRLADISHFYGKQVVITEKRDGENTTLYTDAIHARSLNNRYHDSQSWVRQLHASIANDIPEGMRICGENLYAQHSLRYENLSTYFEVFSVWQEDYCLSWAETVEWVELLGLSTVPVLYIGEWDVEFVQQVMQINPSVQEGYVVRNSERFYYQEFSQNVAKYVREGHVTTNESWRMKWKKNQLTY